MKGFVAASLVVGALAGCNEANVKFEQQASVPQDSIDRVREMQKSFQPRDDIADLIAQLTQEMAIEHVSILSGEHSSSSQETRTSASISNPNGILSAIDYVTNKMTDYGFSVSNHTFNNNWGPNVISVLPGTSSPDELVILGAHLDDIPSNGRAPGANDDGSGSGALLAIAQTIFEAGATFEKTLVLEHYSGEEQGLVGSRALARVRRDNADTVVAMIQQDMIGVQLSQDPVGLAFVQSSSTTDPTLTDYVEEIAREYADSRLTIYHRVISGTDCCSDHQSYRENGFVSVGLIEPRGYTGDPQYHRVGDVVDRSEYSTLQVALSARIGLAAAADIANLN